MKRLSHKALKETGRALGGYEMPGNVYYYENDIYYISLFETVDAGTPCDVDAVNNIIREVKEKFPTAAHASARQLFYSAGIYGNTGQLHAVTIQDGNYNKINEIIVFF